MFLLSSKLRRTSAPGGPWYEYMKEICPICGHKGACMIHEDQNRVVCIRVSSEKEWAKNSALPGYLHFLEGETKKFDFSTVPDIPDNPKKADTDLNRVYRELLNCISLSPAHKKHLTSPDRQLTEEQIKVRQYSSTPDKPWQVVKELAERLGDDNFVGVPGFYVREGRYGKYYTMSGFKGILIPFRNHKNEIVGFQVRVDKVLNDVSIDSNVNGFNARITKQPNMATCYLDGEKIFEGEITKDWMPIHADGTNVGHIKLSKGQKYFWFSSANKEGGTGSGNPAPVHVSVPTSVLKEWKPGTVHKSRTAWLGEGPLKNDIAADKITEFYDPLELEDIGTTFLGLPGVNSWRLALPYLEAMGVQQVNIAFDADAINNPYVKQHLFACAKELKKRGYTANIAVWNLNDGKGLDDILLKNRLPLFKRLF